MGIMRKKLQHYIGAIDAFLQRIEGEPLSLGAFFAVFTMIIIVRMVEQQWLDGFPLYTASGQFYEFAQTFLFFLFSFTLFLLFLRSIVRVPFAHAANVLLVGFLISFVPSIVDTLRFDTFWSYYEFAGLRDLIHAFWTVFGDTPSIGITDGNRIEIVLSVFAMTFYAYLRTRSVWRSVFVAFGTYVILFFLASLPSWITLSVYGWQQGFLSVSSAHVAQMFLAPNPLFAHQINDINAVLHVHMSIIYALSMIFLGGVLSWRYRHDLWQSVRNVSVWRHVITAEVFFLSGVVTVMLFGFQTPVIFLLSVFAVPAFLLVIASIALLFIAISCIGAIYNAKKRYVRALYTVSSVALISALLGIFIVSNRAGIHAVAIVSITLMSTFAPLRFLAVPPLQYGIAMMRYILVYLLGVALMTESAITAVTTGRVLIIVGLFACGAALTMDPYMYHRRRRILALAIYWFIVGIALLLLTNLFAYKVWFIGIGTMAVALLYHVAYRKSLQ